MLIQPVQPDHVDPDFTPDDYAAYKLRQAARAIVFCGAKVALVYVAEHDYYMLPGGGVAQGEGVDAALQRELQEELGLRADIGNRVGDIAVYFDRWKQKQTDTCFTAYVSGPVGEAQPTAFERDEGHTVIWADSVEAALVLMQSAHPTNRDGKLIKKRDSAFLHALLKNRRHCYLFALEVVPLKIGKVYDELPLHSTLMHRFWTSLSPEALVSQTQDLFSNTLPVSLTVSERTTLGPNDRTVALLKHTPDIDRLNTVLYDRLNQLGVEYTAPQWVGPGHVFHVTDRPDSSLSPGQSLVCPTAYLIEVKVPGFEGARIPRAKVMFGHDR